MCRIFYLLLFALTLNSCHTTFYYAQLNTTNPYVEKDSIGNFVVNSDSIKIVYSFSGENAPLKINVFNKMKRSLFIDWDSSFFYIGDNPDNKISLGDYIKDYKTLEIKPFSNKERDLFELSGLKFDELDKNSFKKQEVKLSYNRTAKYNTIYFDEMTTPLYMKSSLSIHIESYSNEPIFYEHDFYINKVTNAGSTPPYDILETANKQGDVFYTRKEHGRGLKQALSVGGQILLITGIVAVEIITSTDSE